MYFRFIFIVLLCLGCSQPKRNLTSLSLNLSKEPLSLDPRFHSDLVLNQLHYMLYRPLFKLNKDGIIQKDLVSKYSISLDQKEYRFTLKRAHWSDGSLLSAQDIEKSYKQALNPDFPSKDAYLFYSIKGAKRLIEKKGSLCDLGIQALDNQTLHIRLEKEDPFFLEKLTTCAYLPIKGHLYSGPYKLQTWKLKDRMILKKNPFYEKDLYFDTINISFIPSESSALDLFFKKKLDMIGFPITSIPVASSKFLNLHFPSKTTPIYGTKLLMFNHNRKFQDLSLKKALFHSIEKKEIVENITHQKEIAAYGLLPNISFKNSYSECTAKTYLNDHLLSEPITLIYAEGEINHLIAQQLKNRWGTVLNIDVILQKCELSLLRERLQRKDYDMALISWIGEYPSSVNLLDRLSSKDHFKNETGWENKEYQQYLNSRNFLEAEKVLEKEIPVIPLYYWNLKIYFQKDLKNIQISPTGLIFFEDIQRI